MVSYDQYFTQTKMMNFSLKLHRSSSEITAWAPSENCCNPPNHDRQKDTAL